MSDFCGLRRRWLCGLFLFGAACGAWAGSFSVNPIRLDFDAAARTGSIALTNDDTVPLSFQMKLSAWSQDGDGRDQYADSSELIFFPPILTVQPGEKRLIRVGTKGPLSADERSYRLFIEELPDPAQAQKPGAQVAVKLRFGVPLFVAPAQAQLQGELENLTVQGGELRVRVRNTGNRHFRFEKLRAQSGDTVLGETEGWYLLPGAARDYRIQLDAQACAKAGALEAVLSADGLLLRQELAVDPALCRP